MIRSTTPYKLVEIIQDTWTSTFLSEEKQNKQEVLRPLLRRGGLRR